MRRARFVAGSVLGLGSIGIVRAPAPSAQFEWKLAQGEPKNSIRNVRMVQMANAIKLETQGRMEIRIFPGLVLGSPASELAQLRLGAIQLLIQLNAVYSPILPI